MRIVYLLAGTGLFGGTKVALHQAELLQRLEHDVRVMAPGPPPTWFPSSVPFDAVDELTPERVPACDVCIGTFWTTLPVAAAADCEVAVHFCQGYEGGFGHNRDEHAAIEAAYRLPLPAMTVAPHLAELLRQRFGRRARVVAQPLEPFWRPVPELRATPAGEPRVLVASPFEIDWKGVATALEAVRVFRRQGGRCRLVRVSQWPLTEAETALLVPDEYHHHLDPPDVAALMAGCDLLLAPSWEQEGFGLPALEAMACGVPVIASDVSSYRWFAAPAATLVPPRDPAALAAAMAEVLADPERWRRMREAGLDVASRFTEKRTAREAHEALVWSLAAGREGAVQSPRST